MAKAKSKSKVKLRPAARGPSPPKASKSRPHKPSVMDTVQYWKVKRVIEGLP